MKLTEVDREADNIPDAGQGLLKDQPRRSSMLPLKH